MGSIVERGTKGRGATKCSGRKGAFINCDLVTRTDGVGETVEDRCLERKEMFFNKMVEVFLEGGLLH